jgi:hypothetical protein
MTEPCELHASSFSLQFQQTTTMRSEWRQLPCVRYGHQPSSFPHCELTAVRGLCEAIYENTPNKDLVDPDLELELVTVDRKAPQLQPLQDLLRTENVLESHIFKEALAWVPKSILVRPNAKVGVRMVIKDGPLKGQFEAFARVKIIPGELIPFPGRLCDGGRHGYDFGIDGGKWKNMALDPSIKCSGAYVNDWGGPSREDMSADEATEQKAS